MKNQELNFPKKTAALYDPFLDVLGGGEKHILSILLVLEKEGYDISIFWDKNISSSIKNKLNLQFRNLTFIPNIFTPYSAFKKIMLLKRFDLFFYVTNGSYFFSTAKKNIVFCMIPNHSLYQMNLINKLKTMNIRFIANSSFTQKWLQKWKIDSHVIYPYVSDDLLQTNIETTKKEQIILSVGRFFGHLHTKQHEQIINTFVIFQNKHPGFTLVLVGGLKEEDKPYYNKLQKQIGNNKQIILKPNLPYKELLNFYKKSLFFWHFTGYGINEEHHPEMVEHLGMTPIEAMATGTIPFCFQAGGPKEIITDGKNGYLFTHKEELLSKTEHILFNKYLYKNIQKNCQEYVKKYFSFNFFETKVKEILL